MCPSSSLSSALHKMSTCKIINSHKPQGPSEWCKSNLEISELTGKLWVGEPQSIICSQHSLPPPPFLHHKLLAKVVGLAAKSKSRKVLKQSGPQDSALQYIAVWIATNGITITYIRQCKKRSKTCSNCLPQMEKAQLNQYWCKKCQLGNMKRSICEKSNWTEAPVMNFQIGGAELPNWRCPSGSCSVATNACMQGPSIEKLL